MAPSPRAQPTDPSIFHRYRLERYPVLKTQQPNLSRRSLFLLIADEFWSLDVNAWTALVPSNTTTTSATVATVTSRQADIDNEPPPPWTSDADEYDNDETPPGIVLRTDYTAGSDDAWATFCSTLRDAEREFLAVDREPSTSTTENDGDAEMAPLAEIGANDDEDDESDEEDDNGQLALFTLISDPARLSDISNLRALRLLFDVSVRASTPPSSSASKVGTTPRHQHRLTGLRGLQETYDAHGRTLWIFDLGSRTDGCTRLVSDAGDIATGDSWRARATHMAELQAGLAAGALMRIDFGGLDRWDYAERQRNMREADGGYATFVSGMN